MESLYLKHFKVNTYALLKNKIKVIFFVILDYFLPFDSMQQYKNRNKIQEFYSFFLGELKWKLKQKTLFFGVQEEAFRLAKSPPPNMGLQPLAFN